MSETRSDGSVWQAPATDALALVCAAMAANLAQAHYALADYNSVEVAFHAVGPPHAPNPFWVARAHMVGFAGYVRHTEVSS